MTVPSGNSYSVEIAGNPGNYDSPAPDDYGTYLNIPQGTWITNRVTTPADEADGVRHAVFAWAITAVGGAPISSGTGTQVVFQVTTNSILTWYWTNQYELAVLDSSGGTVNSGVVDGWYTDQVQVAGIEASPNGGYAFYEWSDDVPAADPTNNPLTVTMDQPRTVTAHFYSLAGQSKRWDGIGIWESATNWTPTGMAGPLDDTLIGSGTCTAGNSRAVLELTVADGATLVCRNWSTKLSVTNGLTVQSGGTITLPAPYNNGDMTNRIDIACRTLTVETNGWINADENGYLGKGRNATGHGPGGGGGTSGNYGYGGGHGGQGGGTGGGGTYGNTNAPINVGSGGGGAWTGIGGAGGGAIRIEAAGNATVDGSITADGGNGSAGGGGGSGGSILLICDRLYGDTNGLLSAEGGQYNSSAWSAGGGRIAVWHSGSWFLSLSQTVLPSSYFGSASVTNGLGTDATSEPGTLVWMGSGPRGTLILIR